MNPNSGGFVLIFMVGEVIAMNYKLVPVKLLQMILNLNMIYLLRLFVQ